MIPHEIVMSSCYGIIQELSIENCTRIYEWEPLFIIKTDSGNIETVSVGVSGEVHSLEVQKGDKVIPGMVLAFIKVDLISSGSE
jgi:hypothetical protein